MLKRGGSPEPEPEPEPQPQYEELQCIPHVTERKRKQRAVPLTPAALNAARDKALGSPRSIAAVRSSPALDHMKGVGTAGECPATARARLQGNRGTLTQLYPRDRTMPLPALGPGSTKAGVTVPSVRYEPIQQARTSLSIRQDLLAACTDGPPMLTDHR